MAAVSLPLTFSAVGVEQLSTPLTRLQRTISSLSPDELLIRVSHSSINPLDTKNVSLNVFGAPLPLVPGGDYSGTVVAVGGPASSGQEAIDVGSEVFGMVMAGGCFAQYAVVKREFTALRRTVPSKEAGVFGGVFFTAVDGVVVSGEASRRRGQWIYVAGAAGGVGHFAVQLAKLHGMKAIGSASKPAALALLRTLQVDTVIDYSKEDVTKAVLAATNGRGADVVYDPTYAFSSFQQSAACVAEGGVWIKLGLDMFQPGSEVYSKAAEARGATALTPTVGRWFTEYGGVEPYKSEQYKMTQALRDAVGWYESGLVRPHISREVECEPKALQQAVDEWDKINVGKISVHVPDTL